MSRKWFLRTVFQESNSSSWMAVIAFHAANLSANIHEYVMNLIVYGMAHIQIIPLGDMYVHGRPCLYKEK